MRYVLRLNSPRAVEMMRSGEKAFLTGGGTQYFAKRAK